MFTELALANFHLHQQAWDKSQRFVFIDRALDPRRVLARQVERAVRDRLERLGFTVSKTFHQCSYDLLVNGIRVEVKAARWDGRRYECNLRSNDADVLVFACIDGDTHFFVLPFDQVKGKTVIKITQHDPRDFLGSLIRWYEAWDIIDDLVRAGRNAWQPGLM